MDSARQELLKEVRDLDGLVISLDSWITDEFPDDAELQRLSDRVLDATSELLYHILHGTGD